MARCNDVTEYVQFLLACVIIMSLWHDIVCISSFLSREIDESNRWTRFECEVTSVGGQPGLVQLVGRSANSLSESLMGIVVSSEAITSGKYPI